MAHDLQYIGGHRHPKNRFGQGSPEFYQEEVKLYGCSSLAEYIALRESHAPKCPVCGTPAGFSMGTGDCGCEVD